MRSVAIVGFGRFGKTLYRLLRDDFDIVLFDTRQISKRDISGERTRVAKSVSDIYAGDEERTIFYCVPISAFEKVIQAHRRHIKKNHILIDTLSVKIHPQKVFARCLKDSAVQTMLTHPMFGPDSAKASFAGLPIVLEKNTASAQTYLFWKRYFSRKGLRVEELSAEEHDKRAANSQGVAHFIGRLLGEFGLEETPIDTLGAKKLHEVMEQTCNDTWQLFSDLQTYNPYTRRMRLHIGSAYDKVYGRLLPKRLHKDRIVFGIQGGKGSFNEQALHHYIKKEGIEAFETKYLYTTERVLSELHKGLIDFGQFAMHNSVGGIVDESVSAMARYKFAIVEEFGIPIAHFMMKRPDAAREDVDTIMAHPQVFRQCGATLAREYPDLKLVSGKGDLIDHANVARHLAAKRLGKHIGVMGPRILSDIYKLDVIAENLQDAKDNITSFLMVKR